MLPAEQTFAADHRPVTERDDRLVMHSELAAIERGAQVVCQALLASEFGTQLSIEDRDAVAPSRLRVIHGEVGFVD